MSATRRSITTALLLLAACIATPLQAARDAVTARGFVANQVYSFGEIDDVSALSGNLGVTIPIGQSYTTGGMLSYQFTARYNSNIWDYIEYTTSEPHVVKLSPSGSNPYVYDAWDDTNVPGGGTSYMEAYPARSSNAGLGWIVGFGSLKISYENSGVPALIYVGQDGAEHSFYTELHKNADEVQNGNGPFYTRDGSYLRMYRPEGKDNVAAQKVQIHFPNGVQQRFSCDGYCYSFKALWHLDTISDPFGNLLEIKRRLPGASQETREVPEAGKAWVWTFTEYLGTTTGPLEARKHEITFRVTKKFPYTHQMRVEKMDLAAPKKNAADTGRAIYKFVYKDHYIYRDAQHMWAPVGSNVLVTPFETSKPGMIQVSLLEEILAPPSENAGSTSAAKWEFDYIGETCEDGQPCQDLAEIASRLDSQELVTKNFGGYIFKTTRYFARLKLVAYPTGGAVRYTYQPRAYRKMRCDGSGPLKGGAGIGNFSTFLGIRTREIGTFNRLTREFTRQGLWLYDGRGYNANKEEDAPLKPCFPVEFVSTQIDPLGKATLSYFSTFIDDPANLPGGTYADFTVKEHGIAYSRLRVDPKDSSRFGSSSVFTCSAATLNMFDNLTRSNSRPDEVALKKAIRDVEPHYREGRPATCSTAPVRQTFVRYEHSADQYCNAESWGMCENSQRRVQSSRTYFYDDAASTGDDPVYTETTHTEFDGFGHYRRSLTSSNMASKSGLARNDTRETVTRFNPTWVFTPGNDYSLVDSTTGGFWPPNKAWLVNLYDMTASGENGAWSQIRHKFDQTTGFLEAMRTLSNTAKPGALGATLAPVDSAGDLRQDDVLVTFKRAVENGHVVISEGHSGAGHDESYGQILSTVLSSQFNEPSAGVKYDIQTTTRFGGLRKKEYVGCDPFVIEDNVVDDNTGLVLVSKDGTGVTTAYHYDHLGRLTKMFPPYDKAAASCTNATIPTTQCETVWTYEYPDLPTGLVKVKVELRAKNNDALLDRQWIEYDHLGRVVSEEDELPGGIARSRQAGYLITGQKAWESAGGVKNAAAKNTTRFHYDPLGRVTCVQHPGNDRTGGVCSASDTMTTSMTYQGVRRVDRTTNGFAGPGLDVTSAATVTEHLDQHGRLIAVTEASASAPATTEYEYDMRDRLVKVTEAQNKTRTFLYDGRGFLTEEDHPELASAKITYSKFDPRGNFSIRRVQGSPDAGFDLRYKYDGAEQVTEVRSLAPDRVLKTFRYDNAGRILQAGRTNYVSDVTKTSVETQIGVTTDFKYHVDTGRAMKKTTSGPVTTAVAYAYNAIGQPGRLTYPKLELPTLVVDPQRPAVTMGYAMGALTSVAPYITSMTYEKSGLASQIVRANGTADVVTSDPAFPRPRTIQVKSGATYGTLLWSAGTYAYDVNGSVKSITRAADAVDKFAYDAVGRLKAASLGRDPNAPGAAAAGGVQQDFLYDRYGNLTQMTRQGTPVTLDPDPLTNRLRLPYEYDGAGNLKKFSRGAYQVSVVYGPFNLARLAEAKNGDALVFGRIYVYDAFDERVLVQDYNTPGGSEESKISQLWTARGIGNEVLREFRKVGTNPWTWRRDHIFRGSVPAATIRSDNTVHHLHTDHLGTPRYVTGNNASVIDYRLYLPFGEEVQPRVDGNDVRLKFTGHERDDDGTLETIGDLDYMHARYYSAPMGRFLSVDPGRDSSAKRPQSWNMYAYARNNPLSLFDPDGLKARLYTYVGFTGPGQGTELPTADHIRSELRTELGTRVVNHEFQKNPDASPADFRTGLGDSEGMTMFIGHSYAPGAGLLFGPLRDDGLQNLTNKNSVVLLAACDSDRFAGLFGITGSSKGQAFVGWSGTVNSMVLAEMTTKIVKQMERGKTVGDAVATVRKELKERGVTSFKIVLIGDVNVKITKDELKTNAPELE